MMPNGPWLTPVARTQPPMADMGRSGCRKDGSLMPWPGQLHRDGPPPAVRELGVARARPQRAAQVALGPGEQAVPHLAVGGQPDPVAVPAERPGHRRDHPDPGRTAVHQERLGGRRAALMRVVGGEAEFAAERGQDLIRGHHLGALPAVLRVQRHLLDEAQLVAVIEAEPQQRRGLVVVEVAHQHRVDLDRDQARRGRGGQPVQHVGQPVPAGQLAERLRAQRVQRHVDPVQPGRVQRRRRCGRARSRWW